MAKTVYLSGRDNSLVFIFPVSPGGASGAWRITVISLRAARGRDSASLRHILPCHMELPPPSICITLSVLKMKRLLSETHSIISDDPCKTRGPILKHCAPNLQRLYIIRKKCVTQCNRRRIKSLTIIILSCGLLIQNLCKDHNHAISSTLSYK